MECNNVQDLLSTYIDNECSDDERKIVEEHLKTCSECNEELNELKALFSGLNALEEIEVPNGFHDDVMDKIKVLNQENKRNVFKQYKRIVPNIAALFVIVIVLGMVTKYGFRSDMTQDSVKSKAPEMAEAVMEEEKYEIGNTELEDNIFESEIVEIVAETGIPEEAIEYEAENELIGSDAPSPRSSEIPDENMTAKESAISDSGNLSSVDEEIPYIIEYDGSDLIDNQLDYGTIDYSQDIDNIEVSQDVELNESFTHTGGYSVSGEVDENTTIVENKIINESTVVDENTIIEETDSMNEAQVLIDEEVESEIELATSSMNNDYRDNIIIISIIVMVIVSLIGIGIYFRIRSRKDDKK